MLQARSFRSAQAKPARRFLRARVGVARLAVSLHSGLGARRPAVSDERIGWLMFAGDQVTKLSLHVAEGDAPLRSTPLAGIEAVKNGAGGMSMVVVVAVRMAQTAPAPARFCAVLVLRSLQRFRRHCVGAAWARASAAWRGVVFVCAHAHACACT